MLWLYWDLSLWVVQCTDLKGCDTHTHTHKCQCRIFYIETDAAGKHCGRFWRYSLLVPLLKMTSTVLPCCINFYVKYFTLKFVCVCVCVCGVCVWCVCVYVCVCVWCVCVVCVCVWCVCVVCVCGVCACVCVSQSFKSVHCTTQKLRSQYSHSKRIYNYNFNCVYLTGLTMTTHWSKHVAVLSFVST